MTIATNVRMKDDGSHEAYETVKGWRPATKIEQRIHYQDQGLTEAQEQRYVAQTIRDRRTINESEQEHGR